MHCARSLGLLLSFVALTIVAGCGDDRKTAPVRGIVTIDGQPAADVLVHFQPETPPGQQVGMLDAADSSGVTDSQGRYELRTGDTDESGALIGKHVVRFTDRKATSDADGGVTKTPPARFPARYGDGSMTFEVTPAGAESANFDLQTK